MSLEERLAKARKLAELMGTGRQTDHNKNSVRAKEVDLKRTLEEKSREYHVELRAKHMTDEQLDALIEFYESDIGASITEGKDYQRI